MTEVPYDLDTPEEQEDGKVLVTECHWKFDMN